MRRKIFTVLTGTLTAAMILGMTSFAAVDDSQLSGTTIEFWHSMGGVNGEALTYLIDKFNNENEYGITVNAEYQGEYDDAINKLKSAQIGNMGADLVQIYDLGTRFMIDSGWVVPMQDLIDAAGFDTSDLEPTCSLTTPWTTSFTPCPSTHLHRSFTTTRICLRRPASRRFRPAWKEF